MVSTALTDTTHGETSHELRSLANLIAWLQDNLGRLLGYRAARLRLSNLRRPTPEALKPARALMAELARDPEIKVFSLPRAEKMPCPGAVPAWARLAWPVLACPGTGAVP
ncbi:MAG: hypothetical protein K9H25_11285 [Rhodospirillum sp.]|nr:hypothetical protein [Rhodospirillum sp.]MCF8489863.1 hypothetical protein [Rhodospirillum sp.]MCF8499426.1 hypothetical protein [Rhodospirillum sp.]